MRRLPSRAVALFCALPLVWGFSAFAFEAKEGPPPKPDRPALPGAGDASAMSATAAGAAAGQSLGGWFSSVVFGTPSVVGLRGYRTMLLADGAIITVGGYRRTGDAGGGLFMWSSGSKAADDGGSVIRPDGVTGAGRWLRVVTGPPSVQWFGARCDGVTDDGPAFRATLAAFRVAFVPVAGCTAQYLVNTTVTVPAGKGVVGQVLAANAGGGPGSILTTAAVDTFATGGGAVSIERLGVTHTGAAGAIVRNAIGTLARVQDNSFDATNAAATDPVLAMAGSSMAVERNVINANRASGSFAVDYDRTAASGLNIEGYLTRNQIAGTSSGIRVWTSDGSARPEGVHLVGNTILSKGRTQLLVHAVLSMTVEGNTFDLATGRSVVFDPVAHGIDSVSLSGNWFADENRAAGAHGPCLEFANDSNVARKGRSGILNTNVVGNQFHFCSHGFVATNAVAGLTVTGNNFTSISTFALDLRNANRVVVTGNTVQNLKGGKYLFASDGPGGPYIIANNAFSGGATSALDLVRADATRFLVADNHGVTNTSLRDQTHRAAFTKAGLTVPAGFSAVLLVPTGIVASATITLPEGGNAGQSLAIDNGAFATDALSFSPSVTNFANGSPLPAYARLSLRWDDTARGWVRFLPY